MTTRRTPIFLHKTSVRTPSVPLPWLFSFITLQFWFHVQTKYWAVGVVVAATEEVSNEEEACLVNDASDETCDVVNGEGPHSSAFSPVVFVIGDLHGDVVCARHWVHRTGLIENLNLTTPSHSTKVHEESKEWKWRDNVGKSLIFMGDYIDKGPTSLQTLLFVKALTDRFPEKVIALLGNHELELLKDRDSINGMRRLGATVFYHQLPYASVHPAEYLNFIGGIDEIESGGGGESEVVGGGGGEKKGKGRREVDENDHFVIDLLYNASIEIYGYGAYEVVTLAPELPIPPKEGEEKKVIAITELIAPQHRSLVAERLEYYQRVYIDAFRSDTNLGRWLESRPVAYILPHGNDKEGGGTLFVHGGINEGASHHLKRGWDDVEALNESFAKHAREETLIKFLYDSTEGRMIEEIMVYRGNHERYSEDDATSTACDELQLYLERIKGVTRIAVGHTPYPNVKIDCDGKFLALDSVLGRYYRAMGNDYCPPFAETEDEERTSSNGEYRCHKVGKTCKGQIIMIDTEDGRLGTIDGWDGINDI